MVFALQLPEYGNEGFLAPVSKHTDGERLNPTEERLMKFQEKGSAGRDVSVDGHPIGTHHQTGSLIQLNI